MNCHLLSLFSTLLFVNYTKSEQLNDARQSCKTKRISIPSGKTVPSDMIYLNYRDPVLTEIIDEECRKLNEPDRYRSKRSKGRLLKGFVEIAKAAKKYAKPAIKYGSKTVKYGTKVLKAGAKVATSDFGLDVLEDVLDSGWNIKDALESSEESDENSQRTASGRVEREIEEFRNDVNFLLDSNEIRGHLAKTSQIKKFFKENIYSKMGVSDVKCIKDDFSGVYSIRLQLEIDEQMEVVARRCADIGETRSDRKIYDFYEIPNQFFVEKDGKSFAVNGTMCSDNSPPFCPEASLKRVSCSVMSVQNCEKRFENLSEKQKITRTLPIGIVYYGSSELLTLRRKDRTLTFHLNPYQVEYIRVFEGDKIWIGKDVVYE